MKPTDLQDDAFLERMINARFSCSFMNNKKWIKLIATLIANTDVIKKCRVKLIWDESDRRRLKLNGNLQFGFDYYDTAMEGMISGKPAGWHTYKEIEWLEFPGLAVTETKFNITKPVEQDLPLIKSKIEQVGEFKIEFRDNNLRLYAYLK